MKLAVVLCLVLAASFAHAAEVDDAEAANFGGRRGVTAWDIIVNDPNLSILAGLIRSNNLTAALNDKRRPVTVFAPSNAALTALTGALPVGTPLAGPLVTNILLQHVTRFKLTAKTTVGTSVASLNAGNLITRVNVGFNLMGNSRSRATSWSGGQGNVVNSTRVISAPKGTVFVVNGVLLPNNAFASFEAVAAFYNYTAAAGAIAQAGLSVAANSPVPQKTVFAPNNAAFAAVESIIATLNSTQLAAVLTYHVSPAVFTTPFANIAAIPTLLAGQTLALSTPTTVVAANSRATVVVQNIFYPGGVFQGINAVLVPNL